MSGSPLPFTRRRLLLAGSALGLASPLAFAQQDYPNKPIRLIVPYSGGGGVTNIARMVSEKAAAALGQPIVVENKGGAGGNIGSAEVAKAAPDGYTLLLGTVSTHVINSSLYKTLPFDPQKDFAPITLFGLLPSVLVVSSNAPYKTMAELVEFGKRNPGKLNFASPSVGTSAHLIGEQMKVSLGLEMQHIPYKGGAVAMADLIAGNVQMMFADIGSARPHILSGRLRPLGVTSPQRFATLPEVPTMAELGFPAFELSGWMGIYAPARTPAPIVARLNREFVAALGAKDVHDFVIEQSLFPMPMTPPQFTAFMQREGTKWPAIVKASGATAE